MQSQYSAMEERTTRVQDLTTLFAKPIPQNSKEAESPFTDSFGEQTSQMRYNNRLLPVLVLFALTLTLRAQVPSTPPEVENESIVGIHKEPYHATLVPYKDRSEALAADRKASSWARSLNGPWKFHWAPRPEERLVDFYKPGFNVNSWRDIPVPSNMEVEGYGTPIYTNFTYPFKKDWPRVTGEPPREFTTYTERDAVGSYRRDFDVPANWNGRRIFVTFDGVDSAFFLWVNGKQVGYSVNSRNPAEFDLTSYVTPGAKNLIAVEVYRFSAGSYMEDQDMWRLSGIFRNVTLWSAPQVHVRDFSLTTDLDPSYRVEFSVSPRRFITTLLRRSRHDVCS
ncbi:sugar-binding domain-containing protein [Acidisarcina polymorpha]|uniref:sugar-binding domain-containing protein n=1 Tax=Acidisarcina polymorpha TaxID=2211140 RepID=UPI001237E055|nr:sugar-binding domain-containing protein [Acidisarcina polymorpha]